MSTIAVETAPARAAVPAPSAPATADDDRVWPPLARFTLDGLNAEASGVFEMWGVARVACGSWTLLAGNGGLEAAVGTGVRWEESICSVVQRDADAVLVADVRRRRDPALRASADRYGVRAYVGAPLRAPDGTTIGSLCGWSTTPAHDDERLRARVTRHAQFLEREVLREVRRVDGERRADWGTPAETKDALTHLGDRRAWGRLLQREDERGRGLADPAAVTVVDVSAIGSARGIKRAARSLQEAVGPAGVVARVGPRQFGVLTSAMDAASATAAAERITEQLTAAAPGARTGRAERHGTTPLADVWTAAEADLLVARRVSR